MFEIRPIAPAVATPCPGVGTPRDAGCLAESSESLDARLGTLPFAERLKIENERAQRARSEAERHAAEGARPTPEPPPEPTSKPVRTLTPHTPEPLPPMASAPHPIKQAAIVQVLAIRPGSLLDVFA
ncbi:MAG: hypothetical protein EA378_06750 [Phycisphaerales bacterium]|nr:MAG: hypothetical protein EA378_06750 [Phycisphaerales bacterium]